MLIVVLGRSPILISRAMAALPLAETARARGEWILSGAPAKPNQSRT
jgi:hypothetical protein